LLRLLHISDEWRAHAVCAQQFSVCLLVALFAAPSVGLTAEWVDQRRIGPFVCRSEFSLKGYDQLLSEVAEVQQDLVDALGVQPTREGAELYLFAQESSYRRYLKARLPSVPSRPALFVKGNGPGRVYVYRGKELETNLRHESTHALLHGALPMVPLWLDEGLAEYFEVPAAERANGNPHLKALKWNLRLGMAPHLVALEKKRDISDMTATDYRYAWAWVHFMLHGPPEAHEELTAYLADIQNHTPPGQLSQRLERRLPGAEERLVQHFKAWKR
jgi:hypothetical protein